MNSSLLKLVLSLLLSVILFDCRNAPVHTNFHYNGNKKIPFFQDEDTVLFSEIIASSHADILFLEFSNCDYCIAKGIDTLTLSKNNGIEAYVVVISDFPKEVRAWSQHYPRHDIFRMKKTDFYENFTTSHLPALVTFSHGKMTKADLISY